MIYNKPTYLIFAILAILLGGLPPALQADSELEALLKEVSKLDGNREAIELPDSVGAELGDDALRFFLLAAQPIKQVFYYLEGQEYRPIQAAYNTFGNMHRITPRSELVLCDQVSRMVDGKPQLVYVPVFELKVGNRPDLFAVFLPSGPPTTDGTVYGLNSIDFSKKLFPFNQVTFMNTLPKAVLVALEDNKGVLQPGELLRSSYQTSRKGAGYFKVALAIRDADGSAKLLYNKRIPVFKDERILAIPIVDPWGRGSIKVLTYRDVGQ